MKSVAKIEIFQPGIVIFDPVALNDFVLSNGIDTGNLFELFLSDETIGLSVVEKGVIFPIYQIPEMEYSIFLKGTDQDQKSSFNKAVKKFCYSGIPLVVVSGLVVIADLNALMNWDSDYFLDYREACVDGLGNNDYLEVASGLYDLSISGVMGLGEPFVSLGYELEFKSVAQFPKLPNDAYTDDWDFSIT
ncbi:hypothetical protein [Pseudomonas sp. PDM27]|uniref:hypothetical protein n=1 Tax=Pseudomonas sp. PDM27 TaxID=2854769 RepID=UPI001C44EAAD|nr:hypothetical protein [Pseudomonas sp. PDM27]MBV7566006.1 hypothetical protein [Pseudomonas sp. PDM27]